MSLVHSRVFSINRQRHSADWTHISKSGPASPTSSVASLNTLRRPIVHGKILPRKRLQFSNYVSPVLAVITGQQRLKDAIAVFTRTFTRQKLSMFPQPRQRCDGERQHQTRPQFQLGIDSTVSVVPRTMSDIRHLCQHQTNILSPFLSTVSCAFLN